MRALRAAYGGFLLVAPEAALWCVGSAPARGAAALAVRALGARHLAQAALAADGSRLGAAVDAAHAVSMAGLAACVPRARRAATASAVVSAGLAADALRRRRR